MNTDFKPESTTPDPATVEPATVEPAPSTIEPGVASADSSSTGNENEVSQQVQDIWDKVSGVLGDLPEYVSDFFKEYKRPIVTVGLIFGSVVSVKLVLAILAAVNDVPLLAPTFELIGLTYSGWFIYRYLLRASNRKELAEDFNGLKDQILGNKPH